MSGVYWWVTSTKEADKFLVKHKCVECSAIEYMAQVLCVICIIAFFGNSKYRHIHTQDAITHSKLF